MNVTVRDLGFNYRRRRVLDGVSFDLPIGLTALLGPNGAGKTTLMRIISTLLTPARGTVVVGGADAGPRTGRAHVRSLLGYLPQHFETLAGSRLAENVEYAAWAHGVHPKDCPDAALEALASVGLEDRARSRVRSLSGGMRQRLGIACAIAHRPRILLLDEPTVGIDPTQRFEVRRYLTDYAQTATVLLSTHMVEELKTMASNVIVLSAGHVGFDGTLEQFEELGRGIPDGQAMGTDLEKAYQLITSQTGRVTA